MANETTATSTKQTVIKKTETLKLKNGRTLAYAKYGAENSSRPPVFYFNGTPGSHPECGLLDKPARKLGLLLIGTDRPGFGDSSSQDNRALLDWPSDVLELADHLNIPKFGVIGLSGGGPHVLACLHALPHERLVAATTISGLFPKSLGTDGMMWQTRLLFGLASWSTWALAKVMDLTMARTLGGSDRAKVIALVKKQNDSTSSPQADKDVMNQILEDSDGDLINAYLGSSSRALKVSSQAAAWEMWIFATDWGFELADLVGGRLTIWHGSEDVNVPVSMPDKAAQIISGVSYKRVENEGHVSLIVRHGEEILSELVGRLS